MFGVRRVSSPSPGGTFGLSRGVSVEEEAAEEEEEEDAGDS